MTHFNQKTIRCANLYLPTDEDTNVLFCATKVMDFVLNDLNYTAFKIWNYFYLHKKNDTFDLSYVEINKRSSMSRGQYKRSIHELIDKHYLVHDVDNHYRFYALPYVEKGE